MASANFQKPGRASGLRRIEHEISERGFTLTELVATIVIAGILAAVALPRWSGDSGFDARQFRDETVGALRFAQKSAIAARRTVCAAFLSNQVSFSISSFGAANCTGGSALPGPGGGALIVTGTNGANYASPATPFTIVFDANGRPTSGGVTITVSGLANLPISVESETGYVH